MHKIVTSHEKYLDFNSVAYKIIYEIHKTEQSNKEVLKKITSISVNNKEIISLICNSMNNNENTYLNLLKKIFPTIDVGVDQHIISKGLIKGWNILKGHKKSNIFSINKNERKKIKDEKLGYSHVLSEDLYFVAYNKKTILALETGFITCLDKINAEMRDVVQHPEFEKLIMSNESINKKITNAVFKMHYGTDTYKMLLFLYFFHLAISPFKNKCIDFIRVLDTCTEIDFSNYETIISTLIRLYEDQMYKIFGNNHDIAIMKIDMAYDIEIPIGKLFSLNIYFETTNSDEYSFYSVSPINPSYILIIANNLNHAVRSLQSKIDIERHIKEYIVHNIIGFYESGKMQLVYKTDIAGSLIYYVLNTKISILSNEINIRFPFEYFDYSFKELIELKNLDINLMKEKLYKHDDFKRELPIK